MAVTVDIKDFAFVAADVHVAVGGTVTWTNSDSQQHTATGAGTFDTGAIKPGESRTVTFDEAGSFPYACSFHPFMTGTVSVG
jgi:plastocyanin